MQVYYSSLTETLKKVFFESLFLVFGRENSLFQLDVVSRYSFEDLLADYDKRILWGSLKGFTWIPINLAGPEQLAGADLSSGFSDGAAMISKIRETSKAVLSNGTGKDRLIALARHVLSRAK